MPKPEPARDYLPIVIKVRGRDRAAFVKRYFPDAVPGGIFLRTGQGVLPPLGALVRFRFRLQSGCDIFAGFARVAWTRRGPDAGVGLRFEQLLPGSDQVHDEMLAMARLLRRQLTEFADLPTRPVHRIPPPVRMVTRKLKASRSSSPAPPAAPTRRP